MCGIAGIISDKHLPKTASTSFIDILRKLSSRGDRGFGLYTEEGTYLKAYSVEVADSSLAWFTQRRPTRFFLGHVRAPTQGKTENEVQPRDFGVVVLAHNGILLNWESQIYPTMSVERGLLKIDSDLIAARIVHWLSKGFKSVQAIKHALDQLDGSFACWVQIDRKVEQTYLFRNISTLYAGETREGNIIFSSEPSSFTPFEMDLLEEGVVYDWKLKKVGTFQSYNPYKL